MIFFFGKWSIKNFILLGKFFLVLLDRHVAGWFLMKLSLNERKKNFNFKSDKIVGYLKKSIDFSLKAILILTMFLCVASSPSLISQTVAKLSEFAKKIRYYGNCWNFLSHQNKNTYFKSLLNQFCPKIYELAENWLCSKFRQQFNQNQYHG